MSDSPRTLLLTNIAAPYRFPLFEALTEHLDLTVYFCQSGKLERMWQPDLTPRKIRMLELPHETWRLPGVGPEWIRNPDLADRLHQDPFDIYIAGENITNASAVLQVMRCAKRREKPFLLWSGAIDTPYSSGHWLSNRYRHWLYRRSDAFIAYGQAAQSFLVQRGVAPERVYAGTQVIAPGWIWSVKADKASLGFSNRTVILYVGYLVPRKGVTDLIQAYQKIHGPDTLLVIVGDGPQRQQLESLAGEREDIRFVGYLEGEDRWRHYASADLFVLPTHHDPWPQVINEAMYFGLPIITTDRDGSAREVIKNNGVVVPAGRPADLAAALKRLLGDGDLRRRMGQRSRAIISQYTLDSACQSFLNAIACASCSPDAKSP